MARALRLSSLLTGSIIEAPESLDDIDALIELRGRITRAIAEGQEEIVLDCRKLEQLPTPALGWLLEVGRALDHDGRRLVLIETRACLRMQVRTVGRDAPGLVVG